MMNSASALRRRTPNPNSPFEGFEGATQPYDTAQTHAGSTFFPSFRLSNQYSAHSKSSHLNSRLLTPSRQDKAPHNHGRIDSTVPRIASSIPGPLGKTGESSQTPVNPYRDVGPVVSNTKDEAKVLDRFSSWSSSTTLVSRALSTFGSWFKRKSSSTPSPDRKYPRNLPEVKADIGIEATSLPEYFGEQLEKIEEGMEPCMSNVTAQGDGLAESWTAFKWILLMSTITVSSRLVERGGLLTSNTGSCLRGSRSCLGLLPLGEAYVLPLVLVRAKLKPCSPEPSRGHPGV